jgi:hypothetical protein
MRARLDRLQGEMRERIRNVERQYKREIVLYRTDRESHPERTWTSTS